jgi:hypothetical protein
MTAAAGYSGTPLPRKLGVRADGPVLLVDAPNGFAQLALPGVETHSTPDLGTPGYDVILLFATRAEELPSRFADQIDRLATAGGLWVCWPKRTNRRSGQLSSDRLASDLDSNNVREIGLATGLVDNKVCAVDATWSGLRFVRRKADRQPK